MPTPSRAMPTLPATEFQSSVSVALTLRDPALAPVLPVIDVPCETLAWVVVSNQSIATEPAMEALPLLLPDADTASEPMLTDGSSTPFALIVAGKSTVPVMFIVCVAETSTAPSAFTMAPLPPGVPMLAMVFEPPAPVPTMLSAMAPPKVVPPLDENATAAASTCMPMSCSAVTVTPPVDSRSEPSNACALVSTSMTLSAKTPAIDGSFDLLPLTANAVATKSLRSSAVVTASMVMPLPVRVDPEATVAVLVRDAKLSATAAETLVPELLERLTDMPSACDLLSTLAWALMETAPVPVRSAPLVTVAVLVSLAMLMATAAATPTPPPPPSSPFDPVCELDSVFALLVLLPADSMVLPPPVLELLLVFLPASVSASSPFLSPPAALACTSSEFVKANWDVSATPPPVAFTLRAIWALLVSLT